MRMKSLWLAITLILPVSLAGQGSAWDGTWKLNTAASYSPNPDFIVLLGPAGKYTFSDPAHPYSFFCDGKDFPAANDTTIACVMGTPRTMDLAWKRHGKEIARTHRELYSDEKTVVSTAVHLVGSKETVTTKYVRLSGTGGFAGAWKKADGPNPEVRTIVTGLKGAVFHLAFPSAKQSADIPIDGADAPVMGADFVKATLSVRSHGKNQFLVTKKVNGTILQEGILTLSDDCRKLTQETWNPRNPSARDRTVYDKQP